MWRIWRMTKNLKFKGKYRWRRNFYTKIYKKIRQIKINCFKAVFIIIINKAIHNHSILVIKKAIFQFKRRLKIKKTNKNPHIIRLWNIGKRPKKYKNSDYYVYGFV